ncbi:tricarboxylate transporter [Duganella sp. Leaf126]|uniref:Bug family tripartite tricarboxylate transporter substrate binding protein n=1 Tax=Duganella sp. Leaf126 TaxID=1736266 RepID=UPI0006F7409C|nr:tripartite tricarboxylate transporter substrate-binding protein [Duganella sp. Leaf126]KQQ33252.1 tricarboxylate transporter [Duganella sp. Leaf126]
MKKNRSIVVAAVPALCAALAAGSAVSSSALAASLECIVPSKPGGAMDVTCKLARKGLQQLDAGGHGVQPAPSGMSIRYLPGGIGAVAWNSLVAQPRAKPNTLVAFSGGSLLYLAEGKLGKAKVGDVRWVAALGTDYGMVAVPASSPYKNLGDLLAALKRHPEKVLFGFSGTAGSQDWFKMALLARSAGIDPKVLRFVALEGGGEAFTAMQANYVQAVSGDASEAVLYAAEANTRVLAVLAPQRLPGVLSKVPTAREQGVDVVWPVIRGVWMGPQVPEAEYRRWVGAFDRMLATPQFAQLRAEAGLYPFALTGDALKAYVSKAVDEYGKRAAEFGLVR